MPHRRGVGWRGSLTSRRGRYASFRSNSDVADENPLAFAGLYEWRRGAELPDDHPDAWLNPAITDPSEAKDLSSAMPEPQLHPRGW